MRLPSRTDGCGVGIRVFDFGFVVGRGVELEEGLGLLWVRVEGSAGLGGGIGSDGGWPCCKVPNECFGTTWSSRITYGDFKVSQDFSKLSSSIWGDLRHNLPAPSSSLPSQKQNRQWLPQVFATHHGTAEDTTLSLYCHDSFARLMLSVYSGLKVVVT